MKAPSACERNDCNLLLAEAAEAARELLNSHEPFNPFAVVLDDEDQVIQVQVAADATAGSANTVDALLRILRQRVTSERYRAVAIVRDARVHPYDGRPASDVVVVSIEHELGHAVQCFLPHVPNGGQLTAEAARVVPGVRAVYANQ